MVLNNRFLTQLAPDVCPELRKQVFGPNQTLEKLLQLAQTIYYSEEYEEEKRQQKRTKGKAQALAMTVENVMNQPEEKNAQRSPGEKGQAC